MQSNFMTGKKQGRFINAHKKDEMWSVFRHVPAVPPPKKKISTKSTSDNATRVHRIDAHKKDEMWDVLAMTSSSSRREDIRVRSNSILTRTRDTDVQSHAVTKRNKGMVPYPKDSVYSIMESNRAASTAPEPPVRKKRIYYKNGHTGLDFTGKTLKDSHNGAHHFIVSSPKIPTREEQIRSVEIDIAKTKSRTYEDHVKSLITNATYASGPHTSIRAHYHNQDHLGAGVSDL